MSDNFIHGWQTIMLWTGAFAGWYHCVASFWLNAMGLNPPLLDGPSVHAGLFCAVAVFAGRQLRMNA